MLTEEQVCIHDDDPALCPECEAARKATEPKIIGTYSMISADELATLRTQLAALTKERDGLRKIVDDTLREVPVGYIPAHTQENLPQDMRHYVRETVAQDFEIEKLAKERDEWKQQHQLKAERVDQWVRMYNSAIDESTHLQQRLDKAEDEIRRAHEMLDRGNAKTDWLVGKIADIVVRSNRALELLRECLEATSSQHGQLKTIGMSVAVYQKAQAFLATLTAAKSSETAVGQEQQEVEEWTHADHLSQQEP